MTGRPRDRSGLPHPPRSRRPRTSAGADYCTSIDTTEVQEHNGAFQPIAGLRRFPDQTALRPFLRRLRARHIQQPARLHDQLRETLFARLQPRSSLTFDLNSVILVIYGYFVF